MPENCVQPVNQEGTLNFACAGTIHLAPEVKCEWRFHPDELFPIEAAEIREAALLEPLPHDEVLPLRKVGKSIVVILERRVLKLSLKA